MQKNSYYYLVLGVILLIGFVLRFYELGQVPNGLEQDETSIGYNAYSILSTGRDEYGVSYPLYFKAFGEYKLPVSIYLTVPSVNFFGLTPFGIRFPFALAGFLTLPFFFLLLRELFHDKKEYQLVPTLGMFLLAINPWHIHFSRGVFEVVPALLFITMGTYFFFFAVRKRSFYFLITVIFFALAVYTYNIARLFVPIWILFLIFLYWKYILSLNKLSTIISFVLFLLLLAPFFITLFSSGGAGSTQGTILFTSPVIQASITEMRSYMNILPVNLEKIFFNSFVLMAWQYIMNVLSYLSVPFFFLTGSVHGNHGIGNVGQFYIIEFLLMIIGGVQLFRSNIIAKKIIFSFIFFIILIASLTRESPQATRSFFLIIPLTTLSALGMWFSFHYFIQQKNIGIRFVYVLFLLFGVYNVVYYISSYYLRFPLLYAKEWRVGDREVALFIKDNANKYDKIVFDKDAGYMYTSLLFYIQYPPREFMNSVTREEDDREGFSNVRSFGKYEFRKINWEDDLNNPRILIITNKENAPKNISLLQSFFYPKRPVVFALKGDIISYPSEEVAYVAIESKK